MLRRPRIGPTIASRPAPRPLTAAARRESRTFWLFASPAVLYLLLLVIGPMIASVYFSLTDWNLLQPPRFVGLANFEEMLGDKLFWKSLSATAEYTVVAVPLAMLTSLGLALLMNSRVRGISVLRTIYFLPAIVPPVASAVIWKWVFNTEFGLANLALQSAGLPRIHWLTDTKWVMPALWIMSVWGVGQLMVIFLAGLQNVPKELYEAADIDGANSLRKFRHVTVPLLSPVILFNLLLTVINSFQIFVPALLITAGGPQNETLFYVLYLYQNAFRWLNMGYGSALAWVLFIIILCVSLFAFRFAGRAVYYED